MLSKTNNNKELLAILNEREKQIDFYVLHYMNKSDDRRAKHFRKTVMAIHAIIEHKAYKARCSSLEQYFHRRWMISRAQGMYTSSSSLVQCISDSG
jgi:hypothetical protein